MRQCCVNFVDTKLCKTNKFNLERKKKKQEKEKEKQKLYVRHPSNRLILFCHYSDCAVHVEPPVTYEQLLIEDSTIGA